MAWRIYNGGFLDECTLGHALTCGILQESKVLEYLISESSLYNFKSDLNTEKSRGIIASWSQRSFEIVNFTWQIRVLSPTRHFETILSPILCSEDSASIGLYRYTILIYVSHRWRRVSLNKALDLVARQSSETRDWHQCRIHQFCYRSCSNSYHRYSPLRWLKRADIVDRWWYLPLRWHQSTGFLHNPRETAKVRVNAPEGLITLTRCSFPFDARVVIIRWFEKR